MMLGSKFIFTLDCYTTRLLTFIHFFLYILEIRPLLSSLCILVNFQTVISFMNQGHIVLINKALKCVLISCTASTHSSFMPKIIRGILASTFFGMSLRLACHILTN